jgi:agmatinase
MLTEFSAFVLGLLETDVAADYDAAQVLILPILYGITTSYRRGGANDSDIILEAYLQGELDDEELNSQTNFPNLSADTCNKCHVLRKQMLKVAQETVFNLIQDSKYIAFSGDKYNITAVSVEEDRKGYINEPLTIVKIDTQENLSYEYEGSIYNYAWAMQQIVDMGLPTVEIGIRAICKEAADLIKEKQLTVFRAREIAADTNWTERGIKATPTEKVFICIDCHQSYPALIPSVGTPELNRWNWYNLATLLRRLCEN